MTDPIVALISSYKEGTLIQGTIRSVLACNPALILVNDSPTKDVKVTWNEVNAEDTDTGFRWLTKPTTEPDFAPLYLHATQFDLEQPSSFPSESVKRSYMLAKARRRIEGDFWILTIDADEILIWGEYLQDWLNILQPGYPDSIENIVPLKRTEAAWRETGGFATDIAPSRLVHSSLVERYLVSCWQVQTPDGKTVALSHSPAERMPMYGEPHIHHRSYLRRHERAAIRAHEGEERQHSQHLSDLSNLLPSASEIERLLDKDE